MSPFDMIKGVIFDFLGVLYPDQTGEGHRVFKIIVNRGYKTAAITNLEPSQAKQIAESYGLINVYICSELGLSKRKSEIYNKCLVDLKILPEECLMVDDLEVNLKAPKNLGMITVLMSDQGADLVDFTIKNITDLPELLSEINDIN